MSEIITQHVRISGRVQGVWYRGAAQRQARTLGVTGWVQNNHDGSVEAMFQGDPSAVDEMVTWCWSGPELSMVSSVEAEWVDEAPTFRSFDIRT